MKRGSESLKFEGRGEIAGNGQPPAVDERGKADREGVHTPPHTPVK